MSKIGNAPHQSICCPLSSDGTSPCPRYFIQSQSDGRPTRRLTGRPGVLVLYHFQVSFNQVSLKGTVRTQIIGPCARTLDLPLLVRSGVFFLFFCLVRADFWCVFRPFSRGGNFGLHSTWADYSSSYGIVFY